MSPRRLLFALPIALAPLGVLAAACIIADPPPDVPPPAPHHPSILHSAVVPAPDHVLTTFPAQFDVPVEMLDPSRAFEFNVFVDFPAPNSFVFGGRVEPDPNSVDAGVRLVPFSIPPPDPSFCHVIEFIVALSFNGSSNHTPDSFGGDSIVWFYNPGGDPGGCPQYDAGGLDGAFPDAEPDVVPDVADAGAE